MTRVAVAAPSSEAAHAAVEIAAAGGGAIDAAIAASVVAMVNEPGVCAPGAGGFVTVHEHDGPGMVYDGYMTVPGLGLAADAKISATSVTMAYGGGITTLVGPGSVAPPGAWAALDRAHENHGRLPWADLLRPSIRLARDGFPLGQSSAYYLQYSNTSIFGDDPASRQILATGDPSPRAGTTIRIPELADTLELLAEAGAEVLYRGELGDRIAEDLRRRGSRMTRADLEAYQVAERSALTATLGDWTLHTNPPPAVGGAGLVGLLSRYVADPTPTGMARAMESLIGGRASIDRADDRPSAIERFLAATGPDSLRSPSTIHVSAVDADGGACAVTLSAGYGSGVIPAGTGMWMNNALGELELVGDLERLTPGVRLNSNMAPTVAHHPSEAALAIGSPGADRITTAIAQTLVGFMLEGLDLAAAVERPRFHLEAGNPPVVAYEPGAGLGDLQYQVRAFERIHMFFGGVGAGLRKADGSLEAVADPRRQGAALVGGG